MDRNQIITVVMLLGLLAAVVAYHVVLTPRRRRRRREGGAGAPVLAGEETAGISESMDSVMRALALVQHRYAALVRLYDDTQAQLRETEIERDHWKRQALGKKP